MAAVSGGPDSMALLECLWALGYHVVVAHLDHGLRPGSWEEAQHVLRAAAERGVPAVAERADVLALRGSGENIEQAARRVRYAFLARVAAETGAGAVATGHTADDQVETVLLHLLRGAGTQGLQGMLPGQPLHRITSSGAAAGRMLIRPLIEVWRSETVSFCESRDILFVRDPSNEDVRLLRNRLRRDLIPYLETFNPHARKAIHRAAASTATAHEALQQLVERHWCEVAVETPVCIVVHLGPLQALPEAVQRLLLRRTMTALASDELADEYGAVERLHRLCTDSKDRHEQLGAGVDAWRAGKDLVLARGPAIAWGLYPQSESRAPVRLLVGRPIQLAEGWTVTAERRPGGRGATGQAGRQGTSSIAWLDAGVVQGSIEVRPWQEGDRMVPLGMKGTARVADLLARAHVPAPARRNWPVVVHDEEIVWVPGVRSAHSCRIRAATRWILCLRMLPGKAGAACPEWVSVDSRPC